jgi:hypothetical protein
LRKARRLKGSKTSKTIDRETFEKIQVTMDRESQKRFASVGWAAGTSYLLPRESGHLSLVVPISIAIWRTHPT